jgi:hypothetical protein
VNVDDIWDLVLPRFREAINWDWNTNSDAFCTMLDVSIGTIAGWLVNERPPVGVRLVSLWYILDMMEIPSAELEAVPPKSKYVGQLLAASLISMDEALALFNVKSASTVLLILRGQPSSKSPYTVALRKRFDARLTEFKELVQKLTPAKPAPNSQVNVSRGPAPDLPVPDLIGRLVQPAVTLATLAGAAAPLARYLVASDSLTNQRNEFRDLVGQEVLFGLVNDFVALQSERAHRARK